jgi:hypothetical protein
MPWSGSTVFAHDVSDELTIGRLKMSNDKLATPYESDRARASLEPSDFLAFDLGASATHYGATAQASATNIFQLMLGSSYTPSDHLALDVDAFVSPPSTSVERGLQVTESNKGAVRDKTSTLGFDLGAEYDTAGDTNAESVLGLNLGATSYSTTQAVRLRRTKLAQAQPKFGAPEPASLLQWRADANFTETLYTDTDVSLTGTYYIYNRDTAQSGYYGESVFGRLIGDGIPIAPMQYAIRPSLTHRFGALSLRGFFQYADYRSGEGTSVLVGLKAQYKFSKALRAFLSANVQHDQLTDGAFDIVSGSIGLRVVF